jgi:hypothetical protein
MGNGRLHATIGKAHAIDQRLICPQAKNARAGIASLRPRRQRPYFHVPETEQRQTGRHSHIFVKARRHPQRIRKTQAKHGDRLLRQRASYQPQTSPANGRSLRPGQ